ncbi:hypothetical protein FQZ97_890970 [compost metagenome]
MPSFPSISVMDVRNLISSSLFVSLESDATCPATALASNWLGRIPLAFRSSKYLTTTSTMPWRSSVDVVCTMVADVLSNTTCPYSLAVIPPFTHARQA